MKQLMLSLLAVICLQASAQTIIIRDETSKKAIPGAVVFDDAKRIQQVSDESGTVNFAGFEQASFINVQMLGYKTQRIKLVELVASAYEIFLQEDAMSLNEVVVSANRWEQNLRELSNQITLIDQQSVALQNPQTAADLLGISNKVFIQKSQLGGGSPIIRGFATNRVLLVIDGVRMNNAIFRSGNVQNVISLDPNSIEKAEVVFGPGSVLYGSDAIGGVMDFHTRSTRFSNTKQGEVNANALLRYASANQENTAHLDVSISKQKLAFITSATYAKYDDLRMGKHGPVDYTRPTFVIRQNDADIIANNPDPNLQVHSAYQQFNFMQKVLAKVSPTWQLAYSFHHANTTNIPRYDRLILTDADGNLAQGEWYYGPQGWMMHSLQANHQANGAVADKLKITAAYQRAKESRHNRGFGSSRRTNRFELVDAYSLNLDLEKYLGDRFTLFYGAEYVYNQINSTANRIDVNNGNVSPASTRYPNGAYWQSAAAYMSFRLNLSDKVLLNVSNRFSLVHTSAQFDNAFFDLPQTEASLTNRAVNGSFGLVFNPSKKVKLYSNFSSGFRAPNVDDIGKVFDSEPGNVVVPNPDLQAEMAYSAEAGMAGIIGKHIKVDGAIYYSIIDNAIARGNFTLNGEDSIEYDGVLSRVQAQQNISNVYVYGVQANVDVRLSRTLSFNTTVNYQKGKERDPATNRNFSPTHVAPFFGASTFTFVNNKFRATVYAQYNGAIRYDNLALSERADRHLYARDDEGNPYAPAWITFNIKTSYQINERFSADLGLENMTDKRYRPYSSGITAPGRNLLIALRARL